MTVMTPFVLAGRAVAPGERLTIDLPISVLSNHTPMVLPVHVVHGERPGPVLFISGVLHGDEVLGVEVVRRLLRHPAIGHLHGTLLAVPIVNAFGFIAHSRYMPDRRDLNRSFPGSDHGSLASVLADLLMREVVSRSQYGIDLHTAALHRRNLPQIRISPDNDELMMLAHAFGAPVILVSKLKPGSLRQCAIERGVKVMVYEGGEALRFDETAIEAGVSGTLRVLHRIGMIAKPPRKEALAPPTVSHASSWLRAPEGGILRTTRGIGDWLNSGEVVGIISDPFGDQETPIRSPETGIIIGQSHLPVVNRGDAIFHLAKAEHPSHKTPTRALKASQVQAAPYDEDEII